MERRLGGAHKPGSSTSLASRWSSPFFDSSTDTACWRAVGDGSVPAPASSARSASESGTQLTGRVVGDVRFEALGGHLGVRLVQLQPAGPTPMSAGDNRGRASSGERVHHDPADRAEAP
jgi:hypothetical protein